MWEMTEVNAAILRILTSLERFSGFSKFTERSSPGSMRTWGREVVVKAAFV